MCVTDVVAEGGWEFSVANTDGGLRVEVRTRGQVELFWTPGTATTALKTTTEGCGWWVG